MRTIDADSLKAELAKWFPMASLDGIEAKTLFAQIMHDIDNAPTVEPRIEYGTDGQPYKLSISNGKEFERAQGECCGSCYLCDVGDCKADPQKGGAE